MEEKKQDLLEKADKLLRVWSIEDIQDFLPDLIYAYCQLDDKCTKADFLLEQMKISEYVKLKAQRQGGYNKYTENEMNTLSKQKAMDTYWEDAILWKKVVMHYKMYIDQLSQRKIDLAVINKNMREVEW